MLPRGFQHSPNCRIHALKANALLSGSEGGRGFGSVFHHHIQKPELVSGFFTSGRSASSGGLSRICLTSGTPPDFAFLAFRGLSALRFYLYASRACARSLPVLMRVSGQRVLVGKWLPPATETGNRTESSSVAMGWTSPALRNKHSRAGRL